MDIHQRKERDSLKSNCSCPQKGKNGIAWVLHIMINYLLNSIDIFIEEKRKKHFMQHLMWLLPSNAIMLIK